MKEKGNLVNVIGKEEQMEKGQKKIVIRWEYNQIEEREKMKGNKEVEKIIKKQGVIEGVYVKEIREYEKNKNDEKMWKEKIYQDEGKIGYMKGY